jgi:cytochrome c
MDGAVLQRLMALFLGSVLMLIASGIHAKEGDSARGEQVFQRCYACHSIAPDETAAVQGPSLFQIVGRAAAAIPGFDYSEAMREKAAAGLVWDAATLDRYLADPEAVVPGTRMSVPPMRDQQERADLIAYLARADQRRP